jgi:twitching motility two-component system response regulator PilH
MLERPDETRKSLTKEENKMALKKILVVDDSATDLKKLKDIVDGAGYTVITATSGQEAVDKTKSERPDAVLLDIIMKPMNGFQVCRAITTDDDTKDIPVVLVSIKGEETDKMWGKELGATAYITKPYTPEQLLNELQALE